MPRLLADSFLQQTTVQPVVDEVAIIVKGKSGQTFDLQQWQDSAGVVVGRVTVAGGFQFQSNTQPAVLLTHPTAGFPNLSISGGWDEIVRITTLPGAGGPFLSVTAREASKVPLVLKGAAAQSASLQQWQNSAGTVLADVWSDGSLATSRLALVPGGGYVQSGGAGTGLTQYVAGPGAYSVRHLFYGDSGNEVFGIMGHADWYSYSGNLTVGQLGANAGLTPLIVKGKASQTANLQEWQSSAGTALSAVTSAGFFRGVGEAVVEQTGDTYGTTRLRLQNRGGVNGALFEQAGSVDLVDFVLKTLTTQSNIRLEARAGNKYIPNAVAEFQFGAPPVFFVYGTGVGDYATMARPGVASQVGYVVRGFTSQTGDLQQWQNSAGTVLAKVDAFGAVALGGATYPLSITTDANGTTQIAKLIRTPYADGYDSRQMVFSVPQGNYSTQAFAWVEGPTTLMQLGIGGTGGLSLFSRAQFFSNLTFQTSPSVNTGPEMLGVAGGLLFKTNNGDRLFVGDYYNAYIQTYSRLIVNPTAVGDVVVTVKGMASQTGDLQQWQNSAGTALVKVRASGSLVFPYAASSPASGPSVQWSDGTYGGTFGLYVQSGVFFQGNAGNPDFGVRAVTTDGTLGALAVRMTNTGKIHFGTTAANWINQHSGSTQWLELGDHVTIPGGVLGVGTTPNGSYRGSFWAGSAGTVPLLAKGAASQTANLQEWQNSAGTALANVSAAGNVTTTGQFIAGALAAPIGSPGDIVARRSATTGVIYFGDGGSRYLYYDGTNYNLPGGGTVFGGSISVAGAISATTSISATTFVQGAGSSSGLAFKVGNDAEIWDADIADTINVRGTQTPANGKISFGSASDTVLYRSAANTLTTGILAASSFVGPLTGAWVALDNRTISPSELVGNRIAQFNFVSWTNNDAAPYADALHLRSYGDATGGNDNLVMFRKDAIGMRIWQQTFGSATAYASYKDVALETNNATFASLTSTLDLSVRAGAALATVTLGDGTIQKTSGSGFQFNSGLAATGGVLVGGAGNPSARLDVIGSVAGSVVALVKGAASQTGDLQQWQNSAGSTLCKVDQYGNFVSMCFAGYAGGIIGSGVGLQIWGSSGAAVAVAVLRGLPSQTGDLQQWQNNAGTVLTSVAADGVLSLAPNGMNTGQSQLRAMTGGRSLYTGSLKMSGYMEVGSTYDGDNNLTLGVYSSAATRIGLTVRGAASQSADLQQWQNSAGTVLARIDSTGALLPAPIGSWGQLEPHGTFADFNGPTNFGGRYIQGTANGPGIAGATQYYNTSFSLGSEYAYTQYAMQFAIPRTPTGGLPYASVRFREGGGWGGWSKLYAGYADTAGTASVAVDKNGTLVGTRPNLNFIEGTGITLTIADDAGGNEVDVTIASTGGGGGDIEALVHMGCC